MCVCLSHRRGKTANEAMASAWKCMWLVLHTSCFHAQENIWEYFQIFSRYCLSLCLFPHLRPARPRPLDTEGAFLHPTGPRAASGYCPHRALWLGGRPSTTQTLLAQALLSVPWRYPLGAPAPLTEGEIPGDCYTCGPLALDPRLKSLLSRSTASVYPIDISPWFPPTCSLLCASSPGTLMHEHLSA